MKKLFITILLFSVLPAAAQQMLVDKGTQNPEIIKLDDFEKITFNGTTVNIHLNDGNTSSSPMGDIARIKFGDFTSIDNAGRATTELVTYISADEIAINCEAGTKVTIFNVIGSQILTTRLKAYGGTISIANLPKGIYIVKAGDRTTKIVKR